MIMKEYDDIKDLIVDIKNASGKVLCDINMNISDTISKANGYKIFYIKIDKEDSFFEPEDFHGMAIYTYVSNKFKDCKSIAIPIVLFGDSVSDHEIDGFCTFQDPESDMVIYIGNSYVNILTYRQLISAVHSINDSSIGVIIVSDGMYKNRSNALNKLLSLTNNTND